MGWIHPMSTLRSCGNAGDTEVHGDAVSYVGLGTTLQWGGWKWRGGSQLQPPWENPGWELVSHLHEERASPAVLPAVLN